jgi:UDP-2-acetamido-2,6-beta-L-arabino-hexul-4-ose reductase
MNILVTGAKGFIGRNLVMALGRTKQRVIWEYDFDSPADVLEKGLDSAEVVFHLAGVNRPEAEAEFQKGNVQFTRQICSVLRRNGRKPLIVFSSSVQAALDNPYGVSKRLAEQELEKLNSEAGVPVVVFRLPGVFGKWCRPNYNSVVATFCHNIARGLPIQVKEPGKGLDLVYIDDVVAAFLGALDIAGHTDRFSRASVTPVIGVEVGRLAGMIRAFSELRAKGTLPDLKDPFTRRLFSTYMSYLPKESLAYAPQVKADERGSLSELIKSPEYGQFFVSRSLPGITRGHHYHDSKVEKFMVLEGDALIRLRNMATGERVEYPVMGRDLRVVDIPPGWTHSIKNVGPSEMIVLFWANEIFDVERPDTYPAEV